MPPLTISQRIDMMRTKTFASPLREWLSHLPIQDPVQRRMAALVQVILLGFIAIILIAAILNLVIAPGLPWQVVLIPNSIFILIIGIPLVLLRRGYFRTSVLIIIALFFILETIAITIESLRATAETLPFFTLAIILAGLLLGRRALVVTFTFSAAVILLSAFWEQNAEVRMDSIVIAGNFILLNGLMSVFLDQFGLTLRGALSSALKREEELQNEITSRKQAELERENLIAELEANNAELERFTYTVSHDLRSPLVTIKGFLGMLNKDIEANRQDHIQDDMQRIAGAVDKMGELLSGLLELSRVGRVVNPPEEVDLVRLTQEALEALDARIHSKNIIVNVSPELPTVYGDPIRLREVLENLIDNAAKYTGDQPNPVIEIGARNQEGQQVIFVKDNGLGIDPRYHTRIFNLFEKLDPTLTIEGTGIGLALIKRIIEGHGGRVWVESKGLGEGSTFCFTIPDNRNE